MIVNLSKGYRSACCYAPIRLGYKKIPKSNLRLKIWVCCKCESRNVNIIDYTGPRMPESSPIKPRFAEEVDRTEEG